jgi:ABC-type nitrate/sulfonate/bicarbonate transport system permease component
VLPILVVLITWEAVARAGLVSSALFPSFSTVAAQTWTLLQSGELIVDILTTMLRATLGLLLGVAFGVLVGLAMARVPIVNWFMEPLVAVGFPMPTITLIPAFVLWFGIGNESKILLIALTSFFPICLSAYAGARQVKLQLVWSARALGNRGHLLFWRVVLPSALPSIFNGIRVAFPTCLIVAFVAEMVSGGGGLGNTMMFGYRFLETPTVFAALLTVLVLGFVLDRALALVRNRILPWD